MTFVALVSISLVLFSFSIKTTTLTQAACLPDQRHALIQLKKVFNSTNELDSWNASTDCCIWDGITCDDQTGMVIVLNLTYRSISGELNPALFNLSSLRYLSLADNNFINVTLPQIGFERLANLTHLDLSNSGFVGQVPISISALTNLISLDLSYSGFILHGTGLKTLLSNLTKLQVLNLDQVDISLNGSEWGNAVFQVGTTLQELSMLDCGLRGNLPDEIFHLTNLTELYLSDNSMLSGQVPDSIGNLQYLSILDLSYCSFYGEVPSSITNLTRLIYLHLGSNKLTGTIPMSLFSHPTLVSLYLFYNQLSGYLPEFSNGSSITKHTELEELWLGSNKLTGTIPMSLFSHPTLKFLDLSYNQMSGYLCEFSNGSSILRYISLENNNLQGQLPISLFKSPHLETLDLESNNFNGTLDIDAIKHSKKLANLDLSNNKLSIIEGKNHNKSFYTSFPQMSDIRLASCNLTKFPSFLSYQKHIGILNLSNNSLTGEIPLSFCNATFVAAALDLSYNSLTGTLPPCLLENSELREMLSLQGNKLSGPLPQNISQGCNLKTIDLSRNRLNGSLPLSLMNCVDLDVLDVGNNQIVDIFPFWLGNLQFLGELVLRSNQFYGTISNMEAKTNTNNSFFPSLQVLDLSSNQFRGIIPKIVFENMNVHPEFALNSQNSITTIWKGQETEIEMSDSIFSSLDLSQNEFSGEIPKEIGKLKSLDVLNLSHNALTGPIPSELANLEQLESLDLSSNQLSGHIPQELTSLTFLGSLNVSYNNLVGEIPEAHQFSTFSNASYMGNPGLCGSPLSTQCVVPPSNHGFNKDSSSKSSTDIIGLSVSIGLGLGVGFASVIWVMVSWENGREWFNFIVDRFYFRHFC